MSIIAELRLLLGDQAVEAGDGISHRHRSDASETGKRLPRAVVRPRTVDEVAGVLRLCHAAGATVVVHGGMTGLAGGANPLGGEVALSLERLRGIEDVDVQAATMTVLAGTPLEECQKAAAEAGLFLALDLGSRGSCQIGGNLATNAGGIRVIRYGMAREQVLGLEAVMADGTVISSLNKMLKNNAGYDLKHLFIGSEGTLGVITRAVLRLHPPPGAITTALCALHSYEQVVQLLRRSQAELGGIVAYEALWREYFEFSSDALGHRFFGDDHPFTVILETVAARETAETFLGTCLEDGIIADAVLAASDTQARSMWEVREGLSIGRLPDLVTFDVSLPIARIGAFADACETALRGRWPTAHIFFFGHIGDSNIHLCVSAPYGHGEDAHTLDSIVYDVLRGFDGSVSAEHGIGTLKKDYLPYSRNAAEINLMRTLKAALDPKGLLNPGKVI